MQSEQACSELTTSPTRPAGTPHHHTSAQSADVPWELATVRQTSSATEASQTEALPRAESKGHLPRSAFSFRMSLKFKPLLSVDCLYLIKASFCPFFPTSIGFTGSARKPHFHLEKSDWAHFAKSSSFTVTFSETAITSSCKKQSNKNTCHARLHSGW